MKQTLEEKRERDRKYWASHLDYYNKKCRLYHLKKKLAVVDLLGGKCSWCGFSDFRALQIDHINGGGVKEIKSNKSGGTQYYNQVIKSILAKERKYQLLCANCNWIKRFENNETVLGRTKRNGLWRKG